MRRLIFRLWSAVLSTIAIVPTSSSANQSNIVPDNYLAKTISGDQKKKPILYLDQAQEDVWNKPLLASHASHSSHASHASHSSHASHASHYSGSINTGGTTQPPTTPLISSAPSSISSQSTSTNGTCLVSWAASLTPGVTYTLEEATNSNFTQGLRTAYTGSSFSVLITGLQNGITYYYRVKASASGYTDSTWSTAYNGCLVKIPTSPPTIPDGNTLFAVSLSTGWNLVSSTINFQPATYFGDNKKTSSVWKWASTDSGKTWAVYMPDTDGGTTFASSKGFTPLTSIASGEGFWVNSKISQQIQVSGSPEYGSLELASGWNLVGLKSTDQTSITELANTYPTIISLWKWENGSWKVSLPNDVDNGAAFALEKGFSIFSVVKPGEGFWVNKQ